MMNFAWFSKCGVYRYGLGRNWSLGKSEKIVLWVMLNPSTANEIENDPTIRRRINFSKSWGFDGLFVGNLYGYRTSFPSDLFDAKENGVDIVGEKCNSRLELLANNSHQVICAWGANAERDRAERVHHLLTDHCDNVTALGFSKSGEPLHPLYLPSSIVPVSYNVR